MHKGRPLRGHPGINNLLEFIGMIVTIWLECRDLSSDQACILAIGDSTSAIGWLFNTTRLCTTTGKYGAHLFAARHLATLLMTHKCCLASQHIKGELNVVADLLSFAGEGGRGKPHPLAHDHPLNDVLTQRFRTCLMEQVPENFVISQLPSEIASWVMQVLQIAASSLTVAKRTATREPTESGEGGWDSACIRETHLTPS